MEGRERPRPTDAWPTHDTPRSSGRTRTTAIEDLRAHGGNRAFTTLVAQRHLEVQRDADPTNIGLTIGDGVKPGTTDRIPRVTTLQTQLNSQTGAGMTTDGKWGRRTTDAVHRAQLLGGLQASDIVDQALADFLGGGASATPARSGATMLVGLKKGDGTSKNEDVTNRVRFLQEKLDERGFGPLQPDGGWGPKTDTAVKAFQTSIGASGPLIDVTTAEALLGPAQTTALALGSSTVLAAGVRSERRPFGNYVVIPDGKVIADFPTIVVAPDSDVIAETDFGNVKAIFDDFVAGTGTVQISRFDPDGVEVAGFRDRMLATIGTLLSKPRGRDVIQEIRLSGRLLNIVPDRLMDPARGQRSASGPDTVRDRTRGLAPPTGNGLASDSTIRIPPDLDDSKLVALDVNGQPLRTPLFEILGHELGHALHNAQGQNRAGENPSHPSFRNREEENTDDIENAIRAEHGLAGSRFHHGGRRRRATDVTP